MSTPAQTDGLVVVHVRDQVNSTLAGHDGREYTSPPHQRTDALTLVALLLGRPAQPNAQGEEQAVGAARSPGGSARSPSTQSPANRNPLPKRPGDDDPPSDRWPTPAPATAACSDRGIDAPVPRAGAEGARGDHRQRRPRATRRPRSRVALPATLGMLALATTPLLPSDAADRPPPREAAWSIAQPNLIGGER